MNINNHFSTQHRKFKKSTLQLLAGTMFLLLLPHASAAEFTKQLIVTTGADYDSNPNLAETNQQPVWIYTLAPQIKLGVNDEVNRWFLDATMLVQRHSNEDVLINREDPKLIIGWDHTYELGLFGITVDYQETSARAAEIKSTGVFTQTGSTQKTQVLAAKWQHDINPRWSVLNEGIYTDTKFTSITTDTLGNYNQSEIRSKLTYANTEKLDTYAQIGYLHYSPDKFFDNTDFYHLMLGGNYQLKERFNLGVRGGVYNLTGQQSDSGFEGGVNANYTAERMNYIVEVSRSLAAGGVGGFQESDSYKFTWLFNISELDRVGADYGLSKSKKNDQINVGKIDYQQVNVYYERRLSNRWQTRFSAAHKEVDLASVNSQANVIGVALVYDTLNF